MRGVASFSPVADMSLAYLVERTGVACLADLWRIELRCALPCKPFRLCPDAPLAHLIGTQAKQDWDKGETSLGSLPILRLSAFASASPLANQKWMGRCYSPSFKSEDPLTGWPLGKMTSHVRNSVTIDFPLVSG